MHNNQSLDDRVRGSVCNDGYGFHSEVTGNRYFMKWSPEEDTKYYSRSRYGSPRMLSKSVPRKNKNLARCRINRSLNFDAGISKTDLKFKSPNSSSDSICYDDEKQLTRSAKIMRALNLSTSPLSIEKKKVNKSLNFDMTPSPKRLLSYTTSPCNIIHLNLSTSSPKINKTLNFDSSPAESNISSILGTSVDSIDENQNQTPSQRSRNVKKSLKYLTPQRQMSIYSPNFNSRSPNLRTELKEKIDNIIQVTTPNLQSAHKSIKKSAIMEEIFVSTPRNLFNDFDNEDQGGSQTPKNKIRLIPESMSMIKKSHKKERFSRRLETNLMTNDILDDEKFAKKVDNLKEQRPLTPPVQEDLQNSSYNVNSIKRSHKKDKSKRKALHYSGDELSDDGSIFDYSEIQDISSLCETGSDNCELVTSKDTNNDVNSIEHIEDKVTLTPAKLNYDSDSALANLDNSLEVHAPKTDNVKVAVCITSPTTPLNETKANGGLGTPPANKDPKMSARPSTPKNRINFLQHVIESSVKKSHKKLKDENKKKLLKPRILQSGLDTSNTTSQLERSEDNNEAPHVSNSTNDRAPTPENLNSSRLLLPQFISVKKSHKKDKRSKMLSGFARRQKIFSYNKERLSSSDYGFRNFSLLEKEFHSNSLRVLDTENKFSRSSSEGIHHSDVKIQITSDSFDLSPNKRKLSSSSDLDDACAPLSVDDSTSMAYITAEEEFKIFTPIKKRRSVSSRRLPDYEFEDVPLDKFEDMSRCTTPVMDQSKILDFTEENFVTPEKSINTLNVPEEPKGRSTPKNKSTPKNRSTLELISNHNSVKRSHRKDKKGRLSFQNESARLEFETETHLCEMNSPLTRASSNFLTPESNNTSILSNYVSENSFKNICLKVSKFLQSYECEDSKPSTSYECGDDNEREEKKKCTQLTVTPPNFLKTKSYLKILQNDSIKKSHKKKKEEIRHSILIRDPEASDDGSIFFEEDRIEDFSMDRVSVATNVNKSIFEENLNRKGRTSQSPNTYTWIRNSSNDGSIFDSEEKLNERCKDFEERKKSDETQQSIN